MTRFERAFGGWTEKRLTQEEAARLPGCGTARSGPTSTASRRTLGRSGRQAAVARVDFGRQPTRCCALDALYRDDYKGRSVAHFHERYWERHGGERSCTCVKS